MITRTAFLNTVTVILVLSFALVNALTGCQPSETTAAPEETEKQRLILATTTSTENSGLLSYILPDFEEEYGIAVDVVAVGTGQALKMGEDGNADVLLVHARAREDAFMDAGHGVRREDVMYNDFVIIGPAGDPAGIKGGSDAAKALKKISKAQATFVSRGDDSGTHTKEKTIWSAAEIEPAGDWYISAGQGMGAVLTMADEQQAYTLSDRATYVARTLEGLDLEILVEGDPVLFNPYGVIAVNPDKGDQIKADLANTFIDWLISLPTQTKIAGFGTDAFGMALFTPDSALWRQSPAGDGSPAGGIPDNAALKITGKVKTEIGWSEEQVRAMDAVDAVAKNNQGQDKTYTGVSINALLEQAGPNSDAQTLVFVAGDGTAGEIGLGEVQACADCIVSFRNQGGFSIVMPGFSEGIQTKGVVEIRVE